MPAWLCKLRVQEEGWSGETTGVSCPSLGLDDAWGEVYSGKCLGLDGAVGETARRSGRRWEGSDHPMTLLPRNHVPLYQSLEGTWKTLEEADLSEPWCLFFPPFVLFPSRSNVTLPPLTCHALPLGSSVVLPTF